MRRLIYQHPVLTISPAAATVSKTYVLRSTLDAAVIEQTALSHERLLEEELVEGADDDDDMLRNYGSIIAWSTADQLTAVGLLHVILALILVNGRAISERACICALFTLSF